MVVQNKQIRCIQELNNVHLSTKYLLNLVQEAVDVVSWVWGIPVLFVLLNLYSYEVLHIVPDALDCLMRPWQTSHQPWERVVKLQSGADQDSNMTRHFRKICSAKKHVNMLKPMVWIMMRSVEQHSITILSIVLKCCTCVQMEPSISRPLSNHSISFVNFLSPYSKRWPKTREQIMLETTLLMRRCGLNGFPSKFIRTFNVNCKFGVRQRPWQMCTSVYHSSIVLMLSFLPL